MINNHIRIPKNGGDSDILNKLAETIANNILDRPNMIEAKGTPLTKGENS